MDAPNTGTGTAAPANAGTQAGTEESRNATDDAARNGQSDGQDDLDSIDDPARLREVLREMRKAERKRNEGYNNLQQRYRELEEREQSRTREANASAPIEERAKALEKELSDAQAKIARMEQERKDDRTDRGLVNAAKSLNAIDPEDVIRLIDRDDLTIDDDGTPTNAEAVIKQFLKKKPQYARSASGGVDGGTTGTSGKGSRDDMNSILRGARRGRAQPE